MLLESGMASCTIHVGAHPEHKNLFVPIRLCISVMMLGIVVGAFLWQHVTSPKKPHCVACVVKG